MSLSKQETSLVPIGEDTVASSPEAQNFVEAVQEGNMDTARNVFDSGNDRLKEYCGKYLVSLGKSWTCQTDQWCKRLHQDMDVKSDFGVR